MSTLELLRIGFEWASPLPLALTLALLALVLGWRRRTRSAWALGFLAVAVLGVASNSQFSDWVTGRLERRYPALPATQQASADAAVILGGAISLHYPPRASYQLSPAPDRIWHAVELYRAGKVRILIVAAGSRWPREGSPIEADHIVDLLQRWGIPRQAIVADRESGDTRENASQALALARSIKARRVLLVTSALHMPRALKTFERAWEGSEIELLPAPTDVGVTGVTQARWHVPFPSANALAQTQRAWREYVGLWTLKWAVRAGANASGAP